jgi:ABC-2 type transport system permease protein
MAEGVVFDLGYQRHSGARLGRRGAIRALIRDGLRRVFGLGRRMRSKVMPFLLVGIAVLPALFFVTIGVIAGEFDASATLFGHPEYFDLTGAIALIFCALAAAELLVPDRTSGTLAVYASRPLTTLDYLGGRATALAAVVFGFLYLPHVVLFFGRAWVSDRGFGTHVIDNIDILWETALASFVYTVGFAAVAFLVAAFSNRIAVAAGVYLGIMTISGPTSRSLVEAGFDPLGLAALQHHPGYVKDWIMGSNTRTWIPEEAGFDPWVSLAVIVVITAAAVAVVVSRYRRAA